MTLVRLSTLALLFIPLLANSQNPANKTDSQGDLTTANTQASAPKPVADSTANTKTDVEQAVDQAVAQYNQNQAKDPDFQLSLGIGSLINASGASDYTEQSNVLNSTNLGRASPQYLVGASFRSPFPNFKGGVKDDCREGSTAKATVGESPCWHQRPWKAFINLKLSSSASQTLNGYVLGGSYQLLRYLDVLVGFGFTPFNEASPGFRVTASQYVTAQQKMGNDLNFSPAAMLNGDKNAFDGFPVTDTNGALIYKGNPLEVHYRGGLVIGVALPLSLKSAFQ